MSTETPFKAVCSFEGHAYSPSTPFTPYAMMGGELLSDQGFHTGGSLGEIPLNRGRDRNFDYDTWSADARNSTPQDIRYDLRNPGSAAADNNEGWLADALHDL